MENGAITDAQITASSVFSYFSCTTKRARLNLVNPKSSAWCAGLRKVGEYLQVDLGSLKSITKVATQGRHASRQWVTEYTLAYSNDRKTWVDYKGGKRKCNKVRGSWNNLTSIRLIKVIKEIMVTISFSIGK